MLTSGYWAGALSPLPGISSDLDLEFDLEFDLELDASTALPALDVQGQGLACFRAMSQALRV